MTIRACDRLARGAPLERGTGEVYDGVGRPLDLAAATEELERGC